MDDYNRIESATNHPNPEPEVNGPAASGPRDQDTGGGGRKPAPTRSSMLRAVPDCAERRGVSGRRAIDEAKAKVSTVDLAERLCADQGKTLRRAGSELVTNCLIPDHEDRTPSFAVNPDKNVWCCHGCGRGGGVIDLALHAWGYAEAAVAMAAAELLHEFGHEIPARPPSWYARQARQRPMRDKIADVRIEVQKRRLFRWVFEAMIADIEDDEERRREAEYLWAEVTPLAARMVAERRNG